VILDGRMPGPTDLAYWLPPAAIAVRAVLAALGIGGVAAVTASWLRHRGTPVPYTRKVFHFLVFTGAAAVHASWGLAGTNVYGAVLALVVLAAVLAGDGNALYEALARDSDRPRRALFVVIPLVMTAVGGLVSAILTGPYAGVGYLVAGWGDAVGEPVGTRWGRHRYRVPSLGGVPAERSWEGSAAVLLASFLAALVALRRTGAGPELVAVALACAATGTLAEGVSNHGADNLTVQLAASLTAFSLLS